MPFYRLGCSKRTNGHHPSFICKANTPHINRSTTLGHDVVHQKCRIVVGGSTPAHSPRRPWFASGHGTEGRSHPSSRLYLRAQYLYRRRPLSVSPPINFTANQRGQRKVRLLRNFSGYFWMRLVCVVCGFELEGFRCAHRGLPFTCRSLNKIALPIERC